VGGGTASSGGGADRRGAHLEGSAIWEGFSGRNGKGLIWPGHSSNEGVGPKRLGLCIDKRLGGCVVGVCLVGVWVLFVLVLGLRGERESRPTFVDI